MLAALVLVDLPLAFSSDVITRSAAYMLLSEMKRIEKNLKITCEFKTTHFSTFLSILEFSTVFTFSMLFFLCNNGIQTLQIHFYKEF